MSHPPASLKPYFAVFGTLMVLTAVTVFVAFNDFGALNTPIALAIACTKATLVVLFFMHVKDSTKLTQVFAVAGFFWLLILFALALADYLTRRETPFPGA